MKDVILTDHEINRRLQQKEREAEFIERLGIILVMALYFFAGVFVGVSIR